MGIGGQRQTQAASPPEKESGTHCTGGCVGPKAGLEACGESRRHRDSVPGSPSPWPVTTPTTLLRGPETVIKNKDKKCRC